MANKLVHAWAKHCNISFYFAASDTDYMVRDIGTTRTIEFITRRMNGEKISYSEFRRSA